jgi:hypothetical protein
MGRKLIKVSDNTAIVIEPFQNQYGDYIGVREFYKPKDDLEGEWRPTQKGLSIPMPKDEEAKNIPEKVRKAIAWAVENFDEEHKVLESTKGPKAKKDDDEKSSKKKSKDKDKKKAKKRRSGGDDE